ncbi:MAG: hypothetical protein Q9161_002882 [Pseudevernia consocians]
MPVKWTPEIDQIVSPSYVASHFSLLSSRSQENFCHDANFYVKLLLKILETSDVSPKCSEIAEKWPAGLDRPTPRAISERIFKIRAMAKASGTATHFSVPSANGGTPRKKGANDTTQKATPKKANGTKGGAGKRKRGGGMGDGEASDDLEPNGFKSEDNGSDVSDDETPKKKTKVNSAATAKGKGKYKSPVKVEDEEAENKTIHDKGYENAFGGGDDGTDVVDYAF